MRTGRHVESQHCGPEIFGSELFDTIQYLALWQIVPIRTSLHLIFVPRLYDIFVKIAWHLDILCKANATMIICVRQLSLLRF